MSLFNSFTTGIWTFKNMVKKKESLFRFLGILEDDMILVDLLRPALDILIFHIHDKIMDEISSFLLMFLLPMNNIQDLIKIHYYI
jgi:hypothetical protein